jgi:hypothetical protein
MKNWIEKGTVPAHPPASEDTGGEGNSRRADDGAGQREKVSAGSRWAAGGDQVAAGGEHVDSRRADDGAGQQTEKVSAGGEQVAAGGEQVVPQTCGVGLMVERDVEGRGVRVAQVVRGGAADGRLIVGDVIVEIDGVRAPSIQASVQTVASLFVGEKGTEIRLVVLNQAGTRSVTLVRQPVKQVGP